ncbi:Gfo/Idh/MocA family protein [Tessaracoccus flavus]|uniref:Uncharacterized protein n=1 Tax=Tessaracoccus flavus TaxID=1610493 RepID=A0A1Q2CDM1_9ACTN|nr:Gfo/Idh/MocA family oxidoreductase [Tessaracoccus flavus]AQP44223.1 hypothetical protein RPIT_04845 [Tessaracoccus flavus]SDY38800.1 Predicted dehydrogenase [Tessaracoccus flavus]
MSGAIRIGILGAAGITPTSLIEPAHTNPDVELAAVAARDRARAEEFAAEHGIARVVDSYEALVADPDIDAIYIPLPNSHHAAWTIRSLQAGKHVLVEKPFASNAEEAQRVAEVAAASELVVMEAFHYRYHALTRKIIELVELGSIGELQDITATFNINLPDRTNIRYRYDVAGGATMDLGCYPLHLVRSIVGEEPTVTSATYRPSPEDARIDEALTAELEFPSGVTATISSSLLEDEEVQTAVLTGTRGTMEVSGFVKPQEGNWLRVSGENPTMELPTKPTSYEEQLAVFVSAIREGTEVLTDPTDSVKTMRVIDDMYRAAGLTPRETLEA